MPLSSIVPPSFLELWQKLRNLVDTQDFEQFGIKPTSLFPKKNADALIKEEYVHDDFIGGIDITKNGILLTSSEDSKFKIQSISDFDLQQEFYNSPTNNVKISPCGEYIATAADDYYVKIYNFSKKDNEWVLKYNLKKHQDYVSKLAFAGDKLISGSKDGNLKVWDYKKGKLITTLEGHKDWIYALAVSPDNKKLLSGALNSTLKVWNLEDYSLIKDVTEGSTLVYVLGMTVGGHNLGEIGNKNAVHSAIWIDENRAVTFANDVVMWDTNTWEMLWRVDTDNQYDIKGSTYFPAFNMVVSVGQVIEGWNIDTGEKMFLEIGHDGKEMYNCIAFVDTSREEPHHQLFTTDENGVIKVWEVAELLRAKIQNNHSNSVQGLHYNPKMQKILSSSYDNTVKLWDKTVNFLQTQKNSKGGCAYFLATVPQYDTQVVWAWQGKIVIYDIEKMEIIAEFTLKNDLIRIEQGVFVNDYEIFCTTICYFPFVLNIQTGHVTVLESHYSLYGDIIKYADDMLLCRSYPADCLDNKEELLEGENPYTWKEIFVKENTPTSPEIKKKTKAKKEKTPIKRYQSEEDKKSPFILLDTKKWEIITEFHNPEHLIFGKKQEQYAIDLTHLYDQVYCVTYSQSSAVIWDLAQNKVLHTIHTEEDYLRKTFVYKDDLCQIGKSGLMRVFNKKSFEIKQKTQLSSNVNIFAMQDNIAVYSDYDEKCLYIMDLDNYSVLSKIEISLRVLKICFEKNTIIVGTDENHVLSFELC